MKAPIFNYVGAFLLLAKTTKQFNNGLPTLRSNAAKHPNAQRQKLQAA